MGTTTVSAESREEVALIRAVSTSWEAVELKVWRGGFAPVTEPESRFLPPSHLCSSPKLKNILSHHTGKFLRTCQLLSRAGSCLRGRGVSFVFTLPPPSPSSRRTEMRLALPAALRNESFVFLTDSPALKHISFQNIGVFFFRGSSDIVSRYRTDIMSLLITTQRKRQNIVCVTSHFLYTYLTQNTVTIRQIQHGNFYKVTGLATSIIPGSGKEK